ncbi:hypothetical protein FACS1894163_12150 [Spirochaetia bacterium]|nr:hypothetical protein FACS1894163_12150 [Spirochaetia bacterium]
MTDFALRKILIQEDELREKANSILFSLEAKEKLGYDPEKNSKAIVKELKNRGVLEILYYHPGYISPEEFTHRMLMSILRIKVHSNEGSNKIPNGNFSNINLLFNSLDQLAPRFPLCARLNVFIPGIVDILNGEKVTSLFVAVDTPDQPVEQYGILPMADMVLSFQHKTFKEKEYLSLIKKEENGEENEKNHEAVIVEVTRSAGGERAGAIGILELVSDKEDDLYDLYQKTGLKFTKVEKSSLVWVPDEYSSAYKSIPDYRMLKRKGQ